MADAEKAIDAPLSQQLQKLYLTSDELLLDENQDELGPQTVESVEMEAEASKKSSVQSLTQGKDAS